MTATDTIAYDMAQPSRPGCSPSACSVVVFDPLSVIFLEIIVRDEEKAKQKCRLRFRSHPVNCYLNNKW